MAGGYDPRVPTIDEYVAAGLYEPGNPAHGERVALLDWLTGLGFTVDEIDRWVMCGSVSGVAGDRRMVPGERHDRATALERSGLDPDHFDAYSTAFGFAPSTARPTVRSATPTTRSASSHSSGSSARCSPTTRCSR